ncbi:hypothetical protein [Mycoplasma tauri]|uniref:hypothetical protein n=1 Tax=Mycoplasma tauri TaxID=547987 RepID=UPI001CBC6119|nr:hypothetical protein [Mycoplasma tauri]MBZ4203398.1 hypothetical protein [Mycoplasma tauri]
MKIPKFTEEKLKEIVHYTDNENNPTYEAIKSNAFYKIYSGAKGVSKSFSRMVETVYRIVNEINFCSVWCRNQYNHIKTTLKPLLEKVLFFLAEEHNLDFRPFFKITNEAAYWNFDDGGEGRAIYFQNWEKIQAFQGFTLKNKNFRFGELVIDEPLEDISDTKKLPHELIELYSIQQEKLPLLIQNTVLREAPPDNFNINVTFLYNIFTTEHFLIKDYHVKAIPLFDEMGNANNEVLEKLVNNNFIQVDNKEFSEGLGLVVTMFSKYFVPKKELGEIQLKNLNLLKQQNYRLWLITVAGFTFNLQNTSLSFFMRPILFDDTGQFRKEAIKFISKNTFANLLKNGEVIGVYHGFDPGIHDNAALVSIALLKDGSILIFQVINDIKEIINKKVVFLNKAINNKVAQLITENNKWIEKHLPYNFSSNNFYKGKTSLIFSDTHSNIEAINILFSELNTNSFALKAVRKPSQHFGILDRQQWQKFIFSNKKVLLTKGTEKLIHALAKQAIITEDGNQKRDETINKEIYDVINAFEMSASLAFKMQYILINQNNSKE